jgi:hypothetical protein
MAVVKKWRLNKQRRLRVNRKDRKREYNLLKEMESFGRDRKVYQELERGVKVPVA